MFLRLTAVFLMIYGCCAAAFGQAASNVGVDTDLRLFTTLAALNAAGFDIELGSQYHPTRAEVRKFADGLDPDLKRRLRQFYEARKGGQPDEAQLSKYVSLALVLTDPPELKPAFREEALPPDAREVLGFAELLREFYQKARISQRWSAIRPQYEEEMNRLGPQVRDVIRKTDAYLRLTQGPNARNMHILVELAAPINSINVRSNQDEYYVVLGSFSNVGMDDVRHAYLHFHLDGMVRSNAMKVEDRARLLAMTTDQAGVQKEYTRDFYAMATESLIRAIEVRIDRPPAARADETIRGYYRSGLLLAPYFYESLQEYEATAGSLRDDFRRITEGINFKKEQDRFVQTFKSIPIPQKPALRAEVPEPPPAPPVNPVRELLKTAEGAFNSGDNARALAAFNKVLTDLDPNNGSAFYGIGLIASRAGNSDQARQYFDRALRSDSAEPSMKVWSAVLLGRIFDLECERAHALEYYRQAVQIGDDTRNAQAAAKDGINKPYGDGCK
jgi:tetratricopeptide (TPR) repeat protein